MTKLRNGAVSTAQKNKTRHQDTRQKQDNKIYVKCVSDRQHRGWTEEERDVETDLNEMQVLISWYGARRVARAPSKWTRLVSVSLPCT